MYPPVRRDHLLTSMDWYVHSVPIFNEDLDLTNDVYYLWPPFVQVPTTWVTHVNSKPTPDLDAFLEAVGQVQDNTYVRIRTVSFDNVPIVVSVKTNNHYFPTSDLRRDVNSECGWSRHEIS
jgi:hypothetical protein